MSRSSVVIVGGGQAAAQVAVSLRQEGFAGRIVVIGAERYLPYQRPPLSKAFLGGKVTEERLQIRGASFYEQSDIEIRTGVFVEQIRQADRTVELEGGESIPYDDLVIATGCRPRQLDVPGADHPHLLYLRTLADSQELRRLAQPRSKLVLIGGGYIGLEIASTARTLGMGVTILEVAPQLLSRVTSPAVGAFYQQLHQAHGVEIRCGEVVTGIEGPDNRPCVTTSSGLQVEADVVVAGVGAIPNVRLAVEAGVECNVGILVDQQCRTSIPNIYAAGDCTEQSSAQYNTRIRLESVPNAIEQGRTIAAAICGKPLPARQVPWFWSDQYDVKLQTVGLHRGHDVQVMRGEPGQRSFAVYYLHGQRLLAMDAINRPAEFSLAKAWIAEGISIPLDRLVDDSIPPKMILAGPAAA